MHETLGETLSLWWLAPFVGMLLSIAILPLAAGEWFERNRNKAVVAALFGTPVVVYLLLRQGEAGREAVLHTAEEYVSFIILLFALFTVAGGIHLSGNLLGKPHVNALFLGLGAVFANLVGTTGAAMVLIRPLLRANAERSRVTHTVIFFIFVVCNCGGLLTPLGDPPLFLGFLRGVPFTWTFRLLPQWLLVNGIVILVYYLLDRREYRREPGGALVADELDYVPLRLMGAQNILFLGGIMACVLFSAPLHEAGAAVGFPFVREVLMVALAVLSLLLGSPQARRLNNFAWAPIAEVAIVFAGIFACMVPALEILRARGDEFGLTQPWQYFWVTGSLSSFLDNAPTYLTLGSVAQGYLGLEAFHDLASSVVTHSSGLSPAAFLAAISCGAVFMGANSYIGNAPNFMVRAIAEHHGIRMPHFFGYMGYSAVVLLPVFALVTLVFFV
jgi:Na+/H+ antiporter NhaD/arsenite permease-like protein